MLSDREYTQALANNIETWDFEEFNDKFVIDSTTGKAFVREYRRLVKENEELKKRVEAQKLLGGVL